jgi:hypothetical protein
MREPKGESCIKFERKTLRFNNVTLQNSVDTLRSRTLREDRAKADNYVFEQTVSAERQATFEAFLGDRENDQALKDGHVDYVKTNVEINGETPDSFHIDLRPAGAGEPDEAQDLVRVEGLRGPLEAHFGFRASDGHDLLLRHCQSVKEAWEASSPDANALIEKFLATWNAGRDERPAFAAFLDGLRDDAEHADWQHLLRDRLGLAHYQPQPGLPIPVAMMVYSVKEVTAEARTDAVPMTCPTVLDSKPWPYYFPAPEVIPYGRAMALRTDGGDESLQPELLHTKIKYKRSHIRAITLIERPWGSEELGDLRNHHLLKIRLALLDEPAVDGRPEFGEDMPC